jgi:dGTP triphosphohydrolase
VRKPLLCILWKTFAATRSGWPRSAPRSKASAAAERFLYENLYYSPALAAEKEDAERITGELFAHWMEEPDDLPRNYREKRRRSRCRA